MWCYFLQLAEIIAEEMGKFEGQVCTRKKYSFLPSSPLVNIEHCPYRILFSKNYFVSVQLQLSVFSPDPRQTHLPPLLPPSPLVLSMCPL